MRWRGPLLLLLAASLLVTLAVPLASAHGVDEDDAEFIEDDEGVEVREFVEQARRTNLAQALAAA